MAAPKGYFPGEFQGSVGYGPVSNVRYVATGEFRSPKKGEFYLSGAIIAAYRAHNDLRDCFWIARPVQLVKCKCCDGTGKVIEERENVHT